MADNTAHIVSRAYPGRCPREVRPPCLVRLEVPAGGIFMAVTLAKMQKSGITKRQPGQDGQEAASIKLLGPVGFIGAGKVGTALSALLHARGIDVRSVSGRSMASSRRMAHAAHLEPSAAASRAATVAHSAIVFLTVPDDAIGPLCRDIAREGGWRPGQGVVHCSGALPSDVLQPAKDMGALAASFHPLQAFASLEAALEHLPGSTFACEGDPSLVEQLDLLVRALDGVSLRLTSTEKTLYHAAAVIASNYTVTLAALASGLLVREGIAPDTATALRYLLPLLRGTVNNLAALGLPAALTGPIARGDAGTIARHLQALDDIAPDLAEVYRDLGKSTLPLAMEKSHLDSATVEALRAAMGG